MSPWKNSLTALVLIGMALAVTSGSQDAAAAVRTWTGTGGNDYWSNPGNWNPTGVPADLDDLIVNSGTPEATSDVVTDDGGSITIDGDGTVANFPNIQVGVNTFGTLEITGGGKLIDAKGWLGYVAGSTGDATVAGTGSGGAPSTWDNSSILHIGTSGSGTLEISGGGLVKNTLGVIGWYASSDGEVTISGSDSEWINSDNLFVGREGNGIMTINGGTVSNTNGQIGVYATSVGEVTVDGAESTWTNTSLYVGGSTTAAGGTGSLTVQTGGTVDVTGTLKVWGAGTLTLNDGEINTDSFVVVSGGTFTHNSGTLDVSGVFTPGTTAYAINGAGNPTIQLTGGSLSLTGLLQVGITAQGTLAITDGGSLTNTSYCHVGDAAGSIGTVTVDGDESVWDNTSSYLVIGRYGTGTLEITNRGAVKNTVGNIGGFATASSGIATVDGEASAWTNSAELYVGRLGSGTLTISGGGHVSNTLGVVGNEALSNGIVTVNGTDTPGTPSTWLNSGALTIGNTGSGTLDITSGGLVENTIGYIGKNAGSDGTVTVEGDGSTWTNSDALVVGNYGKGTLTISAGGSVSDTSGYIGYYASASSSEVTVAGSTWANSAALSVGVFGTGTLEITGGGHVENTVGYLGYYASSQGTVTVDGAGSKWVNTEDLYVGYAGYSNLHITGGGTVESNNGYVNRGCNSSCTVEVDGAGSTWDNRDTLYVGYLNNSHGHLYITDGGNVTNTVGSTTSYIGYQAGSSGHVTVGGAGATWDKNYQIYVGGSESAAGGTGTLTVETGGTVDAGSWLRLWNDGTVNLNGGTVRTASIYSQGTFNFNYGTLNYTGYLSTYSGDVLSQILGPARTISLAKHVRVDGTTTLQDFLTLDGGTFSTGSLVNPELFDFKCGTFNLTTDNLTIGSTGLFGSTLTLTSSKTFNVTNDTTIESAGQLVLQNGTFSSGSLLNEGAIGGSGQINAPLENASTGVVRVFTGEHQTISGAGHTNDGQIQLFGGALEFVGDLTNNTGGMIMGNGTLIAQGGTTNAGTMAFSATSNVDGDLTNQAGTGLIISAGGTTSFFEDVGNDGEIRTSQNSFSVFFGSLTGSGSYTGPGTVLIEGDLLPGSSPAVVSFAGNLAFGDTATLVMELYGTDPSEFDAIDVADTLSLAGTLDVRLMDEFAPSLDDAFDILEWSALDGSFDEMLLPVLEGYLAWDTNDLYVTGEIAVIGSLPGDANVDGKVDVSDLGILATNYGLGGGLGWGDADFTGDGKVDVSDLGVLATNYGTTAAIAAQSVPEPGMLALLATCGLTMLGLCAQRRKR